MEKQPCKNQKVKQKIQRGEHCSKQMLMANTLYILFNIDYETYSVIMPLVI